MTNKDIKIKFKPNDNAMYTYTNKGMNDRGNIVDIEQKFTGELASKLKSANIQYNVNPNWIDNLIDIIISILIKLKSTRHAVSCDTGREPMEFANIFDDFTKIDIKLPLSERIYNRLVKFKFIGKRIYKYYNSKHPYIPIIEYPIPRPAIDSFKSYSDWQIAYAEWRIKYDNFRRENGIMSQMADTVDDFDTDNTTWLPGDNILPEGYSYFGDDYYHGIDVHLDDSGKPTHFASSNTYEYTPHNNHSNKPKK